MILYGRQVDQAFIAKVPELTGCAADGATYQEAVQNAEIIIQEWIETAQELGRSIPELKGRYLPSTKDSLLLRDGINQIIRCF